jgi:hypothetical protein
MPRTPEDILTLARRAAIGCGCAPYWMREDFEDAVQEAALAIVAFGDTPHDGKLVVVGKHAIYQWLRRWLRHPKSVPILEDFDMVEEVDPAEPQSFDYLDALAPLLAAQRAEKPERDIAYLRLTLSGISRAGIAQELGIRQTFIGNLRAKLIQRLERIAAHEPPPPGPGAVWKRINSNPERRAQRLANLERINADPEARARRGEAIRAAKARKKQEQAMQGAQL